MQTDSSSYFTGIRDDLTQVGIDALRSRLVDTESQYDDRYFQDRTGLFDTSRSRSKVGGVSIPTIAIIGVVVLIVGVVAFKALKR